MTREVQPARGTRFRVDCPTAIRVEIVENRNSPAGMRTPSGLAANQISDVSGNIAFGRVVGKNLAQIVLFIDDVDKGSVVDEIVSGAL